MNDYVRPVSRTVITVKRPDRYAGRHDDQRIRQPPSPPAVPGTIATEQQNPERDKPADDGVEKQ